MSPAQITQATLSLYKLSVQSHLRYISMHQDLHNPYYRHSHLGRHSRMAASCPPTFRSTQSSNKPKG